MTSAKSPPAKNAYAEVSALIETLRETEERIEDLTGGEVDSVSDRDGRTFLLRSARDQIETSQRKRNQATLAQSEAGLHRAQLMAKLAHVITGPDGAFEQWSETLPQLIGVGPAQVPRTTRAWLALLHPDNRPLFRDTAIEAGVRKRHMELEYRLRRADGEWIHVRQTMEPLEDEGDPSSGSRWFNTLQDVTAERRTEESLRESERRFSDMLGNVQMLSVMLDRDARISYCNDYLLQVTGYRREEVIGWDWFERFIGAHTVPKANFAALLADQPEAMHRESEVLTRSGERRLIRWHNSVLRSGAGEVIGTASIGEDITEQKRAEIRIKRLNRVYAVLSGINTLIVRVRDRGELFREACRIAVEAGQFPLAWVAVADPHDQRVKAVAWAGDESGFLQLTRPTAGVKGFGKAGLSAQAIEKRLPVVCNDIEADGSAMRYAKGALERGYRSAAALPLVVGGAAVGTLVLYAAEAGFFDDEETKLLVELADDISFALDHIEKEEKVTRLTRVHAMLSGINTLVVRVRNRDELFR
jgi:PAS domain S-box-containing protein